jgi:hypothetical protein
VQGLLVVSYLLDWAGLECQENCLYYTHLKTLRIVSPKANILIWPLHFGVVLLLVIGYLFDKRVTQYLPKTAFIYSLTIGFEFTALANSTPSFAFFVVLAHRLVL